MERSGRYRLTRRLGQGGMAEVMEGAFEGESGFRRRVAVKRILPHLASDAAIARMFLDEARIASHLHHAGIVAVLDFGTLDGVPFQVLEFVDGLDLERIARIVEDRGEHVPVGLSLFIVMQIAYALDHAHTAKDETGAPLGIVHRDVSPANVLVSWDGQVKLSDFGIALAKNRLERTQNDGVKGKLEYMSPEQASRGHVDAQTDVFALGCMLHRLITGESPLADLSSLSHLIAGTELTLAPTLDPDVAAVIGKATRSARVERHAGAGALAEALGMLLPRFLPDEPTAALRGFLSGLRAPEAVKPRRGALDALLDLELLLSGSEDGRSYTARPATTLDGPAEPLAATLPSQPAPRAKRNPGLRAALALVTVGLASALAWWMRPAPAPAPVVAVEVTKEPAPVVAPSVERPAKVDEPAPPDKPKPRAKRERDTKPASLPEASLPEAPRDARGMIVIGGVKAARAEILVDGRSVGYAPKRLELPVGRHELRLITPSGEMLGPRVVEVAAHHTQSAPARWISE